MSVLDFAEVPFGKYAGKPLDTLLADANYRTWLLDQPWFAEKYPDLHRSVVSFGKETTATDSGSHEHNEMQARFLDPAVCLDLVQPDLPSAPDLVDVGREVGLVGATVPFTFDARGISMEYLGCWDVAFNLVREGGATEILGDINRLCKCGCRYKDNHELNAWCRECPPYCNRELFREACNGYPVTTHYLLELKPDLGDDYPQVLRQVLRYPVKNGRDAYTGRPKPLMWVEGCGYNRVVVARRAAFRSVTWEQVVAVFASQGVSLVMEYDLL